MIHYHGTPFSGDNATAVRALARRHAMVSFHRPDQIEIVAEVCQSFTIDNGAYSAWTASTEFDIEGFAEFISVWHRHPAHDWYVIPDVIGGSEDENNRIRAHWQNLCTSSMWDCGVPVWHLHESLELLQFFTVAYKRVCIGSSGEYAQIGTWQWMARMSEAMSVLCDSDGMPKIKIHGLRMLDPTIFSRFPFSSADSTNVARNIGMDGRWKGPYTPRTKEVRAEILMDRIEHHASAWRWNEAEGITRNKELFG